MSPIFSKGQSPYNDVENSTLYFDEMTLSVFILVLISAIFHAMWNFAARKAAGNLVAMWLGLWIGCALVLPGVIGVVVYRGLPETVSAQAIICTIATGLIHGVYFRLIATGYEHGEISLVYPIARGSGIALTAILASLFFQEYLALLGSVGIGLISAGILTLSLAANKTIQDKRSIETTSRFPAPPRVITLALSAGATIVAYSLIDKIGVRHVNPVVYIWFMFLLAAAYLTPFVVRRYGSKLGQAARQHLGYAVVIGAGSIGTYLMILFAFTMGPVGYIVAVRELGVVLGALAGMIFLKERFTIPKAIAICTIVAGIICIKIS